MTCDGCRKAVNAVLTKVPGVTSVQFDMEKQTVAVEGSAGADTLLAAIKKTGKKCSKKGEEAQ